jgi:hypothetical protein
LNILFIDLSTHRNIEQTPTGQEERDTQDGTGRTGLAGLDRQDGTGRTGQAGRDRQN